jgi:hypothetical protein
MAERLNAAGFRPPRRVGPFTGQMVLGLLARLRLRGQAAHGSAVGLGQDEYRPGQLAQRLGVSRNRVRRWIESGCLNARRDENGHHIIWADADELQRLDELHSLPPTWANKARRAELKKPKQRPVQ